MPFNVHVIPEWTDFAPRLVKTIQVKTIQVFVSRELLQPLETAVMMTVFAKLSSLDQLAEGIYVVGAL